MNCCLTTSVTTNHSIHLLKMSFLIHPWPYPKIIPLLQESFIVKRPLGSSRELWDFSASFRFKPLLPRYTFGRAVFYIEGIHSHVVPMDDGDKSQTAKVSVPRRNVDDEQRIHFPQGTLFGQRFWGRFDRNIKNG